MPAIHVYRLTLNGTEYIFNITSCFPMQDGFFRLYAIFIISGRSLRLPPIWAFPCCWQLPVQNRLLRINIRLFFYMENP